MDKVEQAMADLAVKRAVLDVWAAEMERTKAAYADAAYEVGQAEKVAFTAKQAVKV